MFAMRLPPLREELLLHPAPRALDGSPCWTLHDPTDNRFFQLGWPAFEILSRWRIGDPAALLRAIATETTLRLGVPDVEAVLQFLAQHQLLQSSSAQDSARLAAMAKASRLSKPMWLLKHYLFFRVPLAQPMRFLNAFAPRIAWFFQAWFWYLMLAVAVCGLYGVSQQWEAFTHTFAEYSDWQGLLALALALGFAKIAHEFGHAFTAHRYGCRVPHMGLAFMVLVPVLYTDTNEAWKLAERRQRLHIASAGMAIELAIAACATLLWNFLPDGALRAGVFLLATSTWLITLAINLSPFMRFDGYFLLADWLNMPNLHERAFAFGRHAMRRLLFGLNDPLPEALPATCVRFLVAFAWFTWLYRLILFLSIAFLVYTLFFKLLGVFLLLVELAWFIFMPLYKELKVWWLRRAELLGSRRSLFTGLVLLAGLGLFCVPWLRNIHAPAVLEAAQTQWLYARGAATVTRLPSGALREGQMVKEGALLAELDSPDLRRQLQLAQIRTQQAEWALSQQTLDPRLQGNTALAEKRLAAAQASLRGLQESVAQLRVTAPFAGQVVALNPSLHLGANVARGEALLQLQQPQGVKVSAYIEEADLSRLRPDGVARFIPDTHSVGVVTCRLQGVAPLNVSYLEHAQLASPFGGRIAAKLDAQRRSQPLYSVFRASFEACDAERSPVQTWSGVLVIDSQSYSFAGSLWQQANRWLRREMSF